MAAQITKIGIINRGLQMLGQPSIASLNENSRGAKAMFRAYDQIKLAELYKNAWNFAIKRASLPADATPSLFGKHNLFSLPGDFLYLAPDETTLTDPRRRDWQIEGLKIITDDQAPLDVRFVSSDVTEASFDVLFAEGLAMALAIGSCEEITNSNTKITNLTGFYTETIRMARKRNAIQNAPVKSPTCSWITVRG